MKIAIIGGGISGLSSAFNIKKELFNRGIDGEITIFEKEKRVGGKIGSLKTDGYLYELGPNGFLNSKISTINLVRELDLEDSLQLSNQSSSRRYIYDGIKLNLLSNNPLKFLKSDFISMGGKLRIAADLFIKKGNLNVDESIAEFVIRRIGKEALEKMVAPMVSGVFAGNPYEMSLKSCFPRMYELEKDYTSLIWAMLKLKRGGAPPGILTSFDGGLEILIKTLREKLSENILLNGNVEKIYSVDNFWIVKTSTLEEKFDKIVLAIPLYEISKLFPEISRFCNKVYYPPLNVVHLGYSKKNISGKIDGFGFLTTRNSTNLLGTIFTSQIFDGRAADEHELLTVMIGGATKNEVINIPDGDLINIVIKDIRNILQIKNSPDFIKLLRYNKAIPNYPVGFLKIRKYIEEYFSKKGEIFLAGNGFYGVGINDCTKRAYEVSKEIVESIK